MNTFLRIIGFVAVLFHFVSIQAQQENAYKKLDTFFSIQRDTLNLAAISAAIIKGDSVVWANAFGYKNIENQTLVSANTIFHMGSISKTITLAAFMHLWENKKFDLHEDINSYLPFEIRNPNHPDAPITFYMLLTHTAGLNDVNLSKMENKLGILYTNQDSPEKLESTIKNILVEGGDFYSSDNFLSGKPGTEYSYSNLGYSIIGYLTEYISEIPFYTYCRRSIFDPLNMNSSTFLLSETDTTNFAFQYKYKEVNSTELFKIQPFTWPGYMDGSFRTTSQDYSNFLIMLMNKGIYKGKQVLSKESISKIIQVQELPGNQSARLFKPIGRAILWNKVSVQTGSEEIEIYHFNGFGSGFFTEVFFSDDKKIAGLFFITGQFQSFQQMGKAVQNFTLNLLQTTINQ